MPRGKKPDRVDINVGNQLRARRVLYGLSQTELASQLGVTFQQLQKYENGANRISAGRLWRLSKVLDAPISYFFEGLDDKPDAATEVLNTRAGLEFVRHFDACSPDVRKSASALCKAISEAIGSATHEDTK